MATPVSHGNNGMLEMLKTQMMTMTMFSSMNNHGSQKSSSNQSSVTNMIYIFIFTAVIEFISNSILPTTRELMNKYFRDKLKSNRVINMMKSVEKEKTASITVYLSVSDHENVLGQALLDYITNNDKTKHISLKKQNFVLNQTDIIEIYPEFFIKLRDLNQADLEKSDTETKIEQVIELFSYTKNMQDLRSFLNRISYEYKIKIENKLGDRIFFFNQHPTNAPKMTDGQKDYSKLPHNCMFTMKPFYTNRKFSNLFGPEIRAIKKRVDFFINNREWYENKGIPYTLGVLLSGSAGSGKTSSIKCLSNETNRHIININLNNDITKTQLENLFFNELIVVFNVSTGSTEKYYIPLDKRIYVLEDIDCQSTLVMERKLKNSETDTKPPEEKLVNIQTNPYKTDNSFSKFVGSGADPNNDWTQTEKLDLSFLLNLLDGVLETPGRIVIMTSNYPEMLDHALIRPGRIDVAAKFTRCSHATIIEMMEFFYEIQLTEEDKEQIKTYPENTVSPAEMGKIMFENFENYGEAIAKLCRIPVEDVPIEDDDKPSLEEKMLSELNVEAFLRLYDNSEAQFREFIDGLSHSKQKLIENMTPETRKILFNRLFMDEDELLLFKEQIYSLSSHTNSALLVEQFIEHRKNEENATKYILLSNNDQDVDAYLADINNNAGFSAYSTRQTPLSVYV